MFALAGFARLRHRHATQVFGAASILMGGWVWTITTQQFVGFFENTYSYLWLDLLSMALIAILAIRYGVFLWVIVLLTVFVFQLLIHMNFVPWLGVRPDSWAYMWWLNGFFLIQLITVLTKTILIFRQKVTPEPHLAFFHREDDDLWPV